MTPPPTDRIQVHAVKPPEPGPSARRAREPPPPLTLRAAAGLALVALVTGVFWGVLEGALYPAEGGPRIGLGAYWTLLVAGIVVTAVGLLVLLDRRRGVALLPVLAVAPLALVAQDWVSLLVQGRTPQEATWYAAVFGAGPHTAHDPWLGLPAGYWALSLASVASLALLLVGERSRSRAGRAAGAS